MRTPCGEREKSPRGHPSDWRCDTSVNPEALANLAM